MWPPSKIMLKDIWYQNLSKIPSYMISIIPVHQYCIRTHAITVYSTSKVQPSNYKPKRQMGWAMVKTTISRDLACSDESVVPRVTPTNQTPSPSGLSMATDTATSSSFSIRPLHAKTPGTNTFTTEGEHSVLDS